MQLDLTFTHDFKYRNLYVGLLSQSPSGKKQELKFPLELMDDGGNWFGKLSGKTISYHADLSRQDVFQQEGEYHFKLYQFMQDDLVCGVRNAAFSIWEEK